MLNVDILFVTMETEQPGIVYSLDVTNWIGNKKHYLPDIRDRNYQSMDDTVKCDIR